MLVKVAKAILMAFPCITRAMTLYYILGSFERIACFAFQKQRKKHVEHSTRFMCIKGHK